MNENEDITFSMSGESNAFGHDNVGGGKASAYDNANEHEEGELLGKYTDPKFKWYIVNTFSGSEESVKLNLKERIVKAGLQTSFGEICIPKTTVERVLKSGKKKLVDKTSYPGYVIVQMQLTDLAMNCVTATPKVTGFVGNRHKPVAMSDKDVLKLVNPSAANAKMAQQKVGITFDKGEPIKVIDGPFTNFDGVIEEVKADKLKLKVLVSIFGRETPVELGYSQVEKLT